MLINLFKEHLNKIITLDYIKIDVTGLLIQNINIM